MRTLIVTASVVVLATLLACGRSGAPSSLFDAAGYHVRGETVYYRPGFPGEAFEIAGADADSFEVLDGTYARERSTVYIDGSPLPNADPVGFELLDRPDFAKDGAHVFQRDRVISVDPTASSSSTANSPRTERTSTGRTAACCRAIPRPSR